MDVEDHSWTEPADSPPELKRTFAPRFISRAQRDPIMIFLLRGTTPWIPICLMIFAFVVANWTETDGPSTTFSIGLVSAGFFVLCVGYACWVSVRDHIHGYLPASYSDDRAWTGFLPAVWRWINIALWVVGIPLYGAITLLALGVSNK